MNPCPSVVLDDRTAAAETPVAIQSPIFEHKNFERLEAQGVPHVAAALKELREALRN